MTSFTAIIVAFDKLVSFETDTVKLVFESFGFNRSAEEIRRNEVFFLKSMIGRRRPIPGNVRYTPKRKWGANFSR